MVFIMDESGSVGYSNFQKMKEFVRDLVDTFDISSSTIRVGVMKYSSGANTEFNLNTYYDKNAMKSRIMSISYNYGGTNTGELLRARDCGREVNVFTIHTRLKERFLIRRNRTKRAHFRGNPLFTSYPQQYNRKQLNQLIFCPFGSQLEMQGFLVRNLQVWQLPSSHCCYPYVGTRVCSFVRDKGMMFRVLHG